MSRLEMFNPNKIQNWVLAKGVDTLSVICSKYKQVLTLKYYSYQEYRTTYSEFQSDQYWNSYNSYTLSPCAMNEWSF